MSVRATTADDLALLLELERICFPHDPWGEASLREALGDEKYLILLWDDVPPATGYILGWNVGDEAEIARVGVVPALRQRGVGKILLREAMAAFEARGVIEIFLEVRAGNVAARRLYDGCAFKQIGLRRDYYADGEDAIVMSRRL